MKEEDKEKVRFLSKNNKAAALTLAVFLAVSTSLTGCGCHNTEEEDEEDEFYYSGGGIYHSGGYYFSSGGTYSQGTWGKKSTVSKSGYSSSKGGSIGS
ncbi:hypothetical protein [Pseudobacteroides cellulosolvens]|uniref:Uncharacterized protein n=1 Tax=Pseudobacteroides cellulosolvens ATCC 35603 = DSM 2933 TaxID=398512 RepID=A0A0L6JK48_9FIRM|nr:hypothetical protein [Pseudobacteroides cellulosolvens]KNY26088.1 hypothetical protein Bccel_1350 [Pseudobacteroides cellulosolvens ATCC 35603 = DSM 2933]